MVEAVGDFTILEMLEGDEVAVDDTGVLKRTGLFPPEGLSGGESEGQGQLRLAETEWNPFGWDHGFGFGFFEDGCGGFSSGKRRCGWWGRSGPFHDWERARSR